QSGNAHDFLVGLLEKSPGEGFPKAAVEQLLVMLPSNETTEAIKEKNEATEAIKEATDATDAIKEATQTETPGGAAGEQWRCSVCGYLHTGSLPADFTCPRCKQPANVFIRVAAE
ncbi:MAG: hypothetical protein RR051_05785, partial [Clostridiales bacterium]